MKVEIEKMDHAGNGIGYIDNVVTFVPKTITGDTVSISIVKSNKKYHLGRVNDIINRSIERIDSPCPYYFSCGGCNIANLSYSKQLDFKVSKVKNIFKKYLDININPSIIGSPKEYGYRNKITFHVDNNKIGLIGLDNNILDVSDCLLVSDKINILYKEIKKENLSKVKTITIKECDNGLILNIDGMMNINRLKNKCIMIYLNGIAVYQKEAGYINIANIKYRVSSQSFFQINTSNIENLYNEIVRYGDFTSSSKVIDLYCGVGSISLYIARYVKEVLGIEIVKSAIIDANENARINNINNVKFICSDVGYIDKELLNGDILIVDPPRTGIDKKSIFLINNSGVKKIIYVSCNPMTLVRDVKLLDNYIFSNITLADMFPETHHVECVSVLHRKSLEK